MVKSSAARKGKSRKLRGRQPNRRRSPLFPPVVPFDRVFCNLVLRQTLQYPKLAINSMISGGITVKSMFDGVWSKLRDCFSQVWIVKVTVYAMAGVGFDEPGYHLLNLAPNKEFEITSKTTFPVLASLPGTRTSRIMRMVSGTWHPTGMDERKWLKTDSMTALMDYVYMSSCQTSDGKASAAYPLELTFDCHVKLRGINSNILNPTADPPSGEVDERMADGFVNLST